MPTEVIVGLFTLAGVVLGFAGQWAIEAHRVRRTRAGIVKAVAGELRANAACAVQVLHGARGPGHIRMRFSSDTWQAARFDLAQFVGDELLRKLSFIYETLPMIEEVSEQPAAEPRDDPVLELVAEWEQGVKEAMTGLLRLPQLRKGARDAP